MGQMRSLLQLDVLQYQWLILTLLIALALVFAFLLSYLAAWRAEGKSGAAPEGAPAAPQRRRVPWILIILYVVVVAYAIIYVAMRADSPPNW
jgi:heme A synthase